MIDDFRPGFLERNIQRRDSAVAGECLEAADPAVDLVCVGGWQDVPEGLLCTGDGGEAMMFHCGRSGFEVTFVGHDWSGQARIAVEGGPGWTLELYRDSVEDVVLRSGPLGPGTHRVSVVATGEGVKTSYGSQVIVAQVRRSVPARDLRVPGLGLMNRGNPYPSRFLDLVAGLPSDAIALDCGGGDRRLGDDRVFNLEYMDFELPDAYGDGMSLPFLDNSFDLVQSQAVLEHVPDPQRAVDEIIRIIKPGGLAYFEVAFMQPLHAVPSHYMNVTPHGISHLCRELDVVDSGEFGGLSETMAWIGGLVDAGAKVGEQRFGEVLSTLSELDAQLGDEELRMAASAVYLLGRKR